MLRGTVAALGGKVWRPLPKSRTRRINAARRQEIQDDVNLFLGEYFTYTEREKKQIKTIAERLPYYAQNRQYDQCPKLRPKDLPKVDMELAKQILEQRKTDVTDYIKTEYGATMKPIKRNRGTSTTDKVE